MQKPRRLFLVLFCGLFLVGTTEGTQLTQSGSISISDQSYELDCNKRNDFVQADLISVTEPSWLIIYSDTENYDDYLFLKYLDPGEYTGDQAEIPEKFVGIEAGDRTVAVGHGPDTGVYTLRAVLHYDLGIPGTFEFHGADEPYDINSEVFNQEFELEVTDDEDDGKCQGSAGNAYLHPVTRGTQEFEANNPTDSGSTMKTNQDQSSETSLVSQKLNVVLMSIVALYFTRLRTMREIKVG